MMGRVRILTALLAGLLAAAAPEALGQAASGPGIAILQGLNKISARISTLEAPVGEEIAFGNLKIIVRACEERPPEEPPESAAFIEIREQKEDEDVPILLFSGWMFASSPALSALDHAIYDVWVLDCKGGADRSGESTENNEAGEGAKDRE